MSIIVVAKALTSTRLLSSRFPRGKGKGKGKGRGKGRGLSYFWVLKAPLPAPSALTLPDLDLTLKVRPYIISTLFGRSVDSSYEIECCASLLSL